MPKNYNHAFELNMTEIMSKKEDASDVTGKQLRDKIEEILRDNSDDELREMCNCFDTIKEDENSEESDGES